MSQQINLFNPIFLKQKKVFTVVPMLEALGIIVIGAAGLVAYGNYRVDATERNAARVKAELAARLARQAGVATDFAPRRKNPQIEADLAQAGARLKSLREVDALLRDGELGASQGYAEYFRALARQHINGLWLTGVSINGAGSDIEVQGKAMQAPQIPNYIARLTGEPIMRGKTFSSLLIARPAPAATPAGTAPAVAPVVAAAPAAPAAAGTASPNELLDMLVTKGALTTARALSAPAAAASAVASVPVPVPATVPAAAKDLPASPLASTAPAVSPFVEFTLQTTAAPASTTGAK